MILAAVVLLVGIAILAGGIYYLGKEKEDREGRRIYMVTAVIGAAAALGGAIWLMAQL